MLRKSYRYYLVDAFDYLFLRRIVSTLYAKHVREPWALFLACNLHYTFEE